MDKKIIFLMIMFAAVFNYSPPLSAQWIQTNGPPGGSVFSFTGSGDTLFAGSSGGIFRSTNGGMSWTLSLSGTFRIPLYFYSMTESDSVVIAGGNGIYVSFDQGENWSKKGPNTGIQSLASSGKYIIAGSVQGVIYFSSDHGSSWAASSDTLAPFVTIWSLFWSDSLCYAGTDDGIYLSSDFGSSWSNIGFKYSTVQAVARVGSYLFAGNRKGIFRSAIDDTNWIAVNKGLKDSVIKSFVVSDTNLFVSTNDGIYMSANNGALWNASGLQEFNISALKIDCKLLMAGCYDKGVFLSTDAGMNWSNTGLPVTTVSSILFRDGVIYAGTGSGLFLSDDKGKNWIRNALSGVSSKGLVLHDSIIYAGTGKGIFLSDNNGKTWIIEGMKDSVIYSLSGTGTSLIAQTSNGSYISRYGDSTWRYMCKEHVIAESDSSFFTNFGSDFARSTDEGLHWESANLRFPQVNDLVVSDSIFLISSDWGVYRSRDRFHWSLTPETQITNSIAASGSNVFAGTDAGLYISHDNGISWYKDKDFKNRYSGILYISDTTVYASAGGSGLWYRPLSQLITSVESKPSQAEHFVLNQNYPNPFNPTTKIKYDLPTAGRVTLIVYDVLGRKVATLVNEEKPAGSYEVEFNGNSFASGVYFFKIRAGNYSSVKKMILLK